MRVGGRFWSVLPYLRPMATVTADTVDYGIDAEGAGCHDLLGTRCDPYLPRRPTGRGPAVRSHSDSGRAAGPNPPAHFDRLVCADSAGDAEGDYSHPTPMTQFL